MKQIRSNVFETNSSSTHSISICYDTEGLLDTIYCDEKGIITLDGGEFGWEETTYRDAETKANYCVVDSFQHPEWRTMLIKVIKEHTGAKHVEITAVVNWQSSDCNSYIDHQSSGTSEDAFVNEESLKCFLFNSSSYLQTDNDNH